MFLIFWFSTIYVENQFIDASIFEIIVLNILRDEMNLEVASFQNGQARSSLLKVDL